QPLLLNISLPRLGLAVQAAVDPALPVGELEHLGQLLLHGGDAPGAFAVDHIGDGLRQLQLALFHPLPVLDDVDVDIAVHISDDIPVQVQVPVDLDDVLPAQLGADHVFQDGHGAVQIHKAQDLVELHGLTGGNVVDDDSVFDGVDDHSLFAPPLT